MHQRLGNTFENRFTRAGNYRLVVVENRAPASSPLQRGIIMTNRKTDLNGLRVTRVADVPEGYQHIQNLPDIPVHTDGEFKGLRVIVYTMSNVLRGKRA
jgi:hypothetical protein